MASALEIPKLEAEKELLALAKAEEDEQKDLAMLLDSENPAIFSLEDADELLEGAGDSEDDFGDDLGDLAAALLGPKASADPEAVKAMVKLCRVCGKNPCMKNQVFCTSPCAADVRGATRQAKEQGPEALKAFTALRKTNPTEFVAAIHVFRAKCASAGRGFRRPQFNWVRYHMAIILASRVQKGTKSLWLTKFAFAAHTKSVDGLTEPEAFAQFERELASLPAGRVSADRQQILYPIESFVIGLNEKSQEEQTQYGTKEPIYTHA